MLEGLYPYLCDADLCLLGRGKPRGANLVGHMWPVELRLLAEDEPIHVSSNPACTASAIQSMDNGFGRALVSLLLEWSPGMQVAHLSYLGFIRFRIRTTVPFSANETSSMRVLMR
jgi:hypothetical protein